MAVFVWSGLLGLSVFTMVFLFVSRVGNVKRDKLFLAAREPSLQAQLDAAKGSPVTIFALQTANRVMSQERRGRTEELLQVAGMPFRPAEWLLFKVSVALVIGTVLSILLGSPLFLAGGVLLTWIALTAYSRVRATVRRRRFAEDLPDTLQLIAGSLRSGFSLAASFDAASQHARDPMASELKRALAKTRVGANLEDGLDGAAVRMRSQDFEWITLAIRIQRDVGGNLSEILNSTVETLRERFYLRRQVKALSAEGRLSAYVLIAIPVLMGGFVTWRSYEYESMLWTTSTGLAMLVFGAVAMSIGVFWMRKIIRIEA